MQAAGDAVLCWAKFADSKVADGTMARKRLILPKLRVLRKWIQSIFSGDDQQQEQNADLFDNGASMATMGDSFASKKDPEHLPATTTVERLGNGVRAFSKFLSSPESMFGFRVACATLSIGIVAFLEHTYMFFMQQRLVWAMIIVAIGMTQSMWPILNVASNGDASEHALIRSSTQAPGSRFWVFYFVWRELSSGRCSR